MSEIRMPDPQPKLNIQIFFLMHFKQTHDISIKYDCHHQNCFIKQNMNFKSLCLEFLYLFYFIE